MQDNLKVLIEKYKEASLQLELAISGDRCDEVESVMWQDRNITFIFDEILKLEPDPEQRLTRIDFLSEMFLTNFVQGDPLGFKVLSIIRTDARRLLEATGLNSTSHSGSARNKL